MKIALISNLYEPYHRGGAEIIVKRTALELVKKGHEVSIITAKPWSGWSSLDPEIEEKDEYKIIRYYPLNLFFYKNDHKWPLPIRLLWHFFDLFNIQSANLARDILRTEKPDLVITHNLIGLGFFIPGVIHRLGIRHIHVLHDIQLAVRSGLMKKGQENAWFVSGIIARIYQKIVKSLFGSPEKIVSPSQFLMDFYTKLDYFPRSQKEVIRNPLDERFLAFEVSQTEPENKEITDFGYIGQLVEHKGLKTLQNAFSGLSEPNLRLHIVGSGPMQAEIEEWAKQDSRVTYKGRIPNEELPRFYQSIDVTVLPTETYENSPTVVFESLTSRRPVIASDIGGTAEPLEEGKTGFLFEPGNSDQLQKKLLEAARNHDSMRASCRELAQKMNDVDYSKRLLS